MVFRFSSVLFGVLLIFAHASASLEETFPVLEGETLTGKDVSLPQAFQGKSVWMIIGFTKDSQKSTTACSDKLEFTFKNQGYSIAIIQGAPFFIKGVIKSSIRSSIPESRRERYFILSEGRDALQRLAGFDESSRDEAYIIGVRSRSANQYDIVFKSHGICDENHFSSVVKSIQGL